MNTLWNVGEQLMGQWDKWKKAKEPCATPRP